MATTTLATVKAVHPHAGIMRPLTRVSRDKSGRLVSPTQQLNDLNRACAEGEHRFDRMHGSSYDDGSVSASSFSKKARPGWDDMLPDLRTGAFTAEYLGLWEFTRGSRREEDWIELINLCAAAFNGAGVKLYFHNEESTYDPRKPIDRKRLIHMAADAAYDSAMTSQRVSRDTEAAFEEGRPHGRVPYGFERLYDPKTKKLIRQRGKPGEMEVVQTIFSGLKKGVTFRAIADKLADDGVRRPAGLKFTARDLQKIARNPTYTALRAWTPGGHGGAPGPDARWAEGDWDMIVDRRTWWGVQRMLNEAERTTTRPGRHKYLLSMIGKCWCPDGLLQAKLGGKEKTHPEDRYICHSTPHSSIRMDRLDTYIERMILAWLTREDLYGEAMKRAGQANVAAIQPLENELAGVQAKLDELAEVAMANDMSPALVARMERGYNVRATELEAQIEALRVPLELEGLITPGPTARKAWDEAPMAARRRIARILLTPDFIGELRLIRVGKGNHRLPIQERVTLTLRDEMNTVRSTDGSAAARHA